MATTLADLGFAFYSWPINCPLPTETRNKGNGIKDLGVRNARTLLAALQNEQLWLVAKLTQDLIESKIPVIMTISPSSFDEPGSCPKSLFANGSITTGDPALASAAATRVKRKMPQPMAGAL
ncbi:hypothetical protein DXG01_001550 [Tephrocybe rancida]|nr:hypothetical protein DXG01_001550 [Tephrocybe rancida]